jgi:Trk K+ transport system NAD-binding subunit
VTVVIGLGRLGFKLAATLAEKGTMEKGGIEG